MLETSKKSRPPRLMLLGPAFVAAIAYVDPGNVAANLTAGAKYGYLLVWVLVMANVIAVMIQYQSAKLGVVTGRTLPQTVATALPGRRSRLAYWGQAEVVAAATDLAEVVGGAIALKLLFGLPLWIGGLIVGVVSMLILTLANRQRQRHFETVVIGLLAVIVVGFLSGLAVNPPEVGGLLNGMIPRLDGGETVLLAASMLGATVMPHAICLHSGLVIDRHGRSDDPNRIATLLRSTRIDVVVALIIAGTVNIALLVLAATSLMGVEGTDTIEGAHAAVGAALGPVVAALFAIGLLASGIASTSVGSYAGGMIMEGLLHVRIPMVVRRSATLIPAVVILAVGVDPTWALIVSQAVLSFGIPFALIPLRRFTGDRRRMGAYADGRALRVGSAVAVALVVALNAALLVLMFAGEA
ncbi:Nramp family divalent metal transporter [Gordonia phosphorivorans]|uniref:Nramp family divalent metal transporter n=1 Tax=Gordonia phosphorivorans TaxID=1056982 RepID=A0ABV6H6S8_9ACTN